MKRRYRQVLVNDNDRWMVSYADFMTLLFAFFVVLYSVTSVDREKYDKLSVILEGIFNVEPRDFEALQVGDQIPQIPETQFNILERPNKESSTIDDNSPGNGSANDASDHWEVISHRLEEAFEVFIKDNKAEITGNEYWIQVGLSSELLFDPGSTLVTRDGESLLIELGSILSQFDNVIRVEGFTDDRPLGNYSKFASNWELSAVRATTIVRWLMLFGVKPERLSATGFSSYQPVASNATAEGRKLNRRINVMISRSHDFRKDITLP